LLRALEQPSTLYDLLKKFNYPHATLHRLLSKYANDEFIYVVRSEPLKTGKSKKVYRLNQKGESFLELVEKLEEILL